MNTPVRRHLPIGIQTFAKIREGDYYYVDKTAVALDLARIGGYYFLSRPHRFGKSLFLDTLKELFEGNESLFRGLYIHDRWDWSIRYPVLRISFGGGVVKNQADLNNMIHGQLSSHEECFQLPAHFDDFPNRFRDLIQRLHLKLGQRVVKYRNEGWPITLIGVEFSRESRNIVGFVIEAA